MYYVQGQNLQVIHKKHTTKSVNFSLKLIGFITGEYCYINVTIVDAVGEDVNFSLVQALTSEICGVNDVNYAGLAVHSMH